MHKVGFDAVGTRCTKAKFVTRFFSIRTRHLVLPIHWTVVGDDNRKKLDHSLKYGVVSNLPPQV
jgi:hypothetical protein